MANAYPSAGSAYAYVSREIHPAPGYLTGWSMMFDYVINPVICVIWCSKATVDLGILPGVPVQAWFVGYALLFTGLNLRGIEASARSSAIIAAGLGVVILLFLYAAFRYLLNTPPADASAFVRPFYDPTTFCTCSSAKAA